MEKFIEDLKEVLEIEDREINPTDNFKEYEEWDSLSVLAVLAMINDEYDITIPRKDFDQVNTVEELFDLIQKLK